MINIYLFPETRRQVVPGTAQSMRLSRTQGHSHYCLCIRSSSPCGLGTMCISLFVSSRRKSKYPSFICLKHWASCALPWMWRRCQGLYYVLLRMNQDSFINQRLRKPQQNEGSAGKEEGGKWVMNKSPVLSATVIVVMPILQTSTLRLEWG